MRWPVHPRAGNTTNWRAGCGTTARTVPREGGPSTSPPYPYRTWVSANGGQGRTSLRKSILDPWVADAFLSGPRHSDRATARGIGLTAEVGGFPRLNQRPYGRGHEIAGSQLGGVLREASQSGRRRRVGQWSIAERNPPRHSPRSRVGLVWPDQYKKRLSARDERFHIVRSTPRVWLQGA
jgi:hypothetical protein